MASYFGPRVTIPGATAKPNWAQDGTRSIPVGTQGAPNGCRIGPKMICMEKVSPYISFWGASRATQARQMAPKCANWYPKCAGAEAHPQRLSESRWAHRVGRMRPPSSMIWCLARAEKTHIILYYCCRGCMWQSGCEACSVGFVPAALMEWTTRPHSPGKHAVTLRTVPTKCHLHSVCERS